MFPVNVSPDMAMFNLLKSQNYDTSYALAEFIDNAIHAWQMDEISQKEKLKITLSFYSTTFKNSKKRNSIQIQDSGPGISRSRIADAFKPAKLPVQKGLSEFGIGMKAAAVWFADKWTLKTIPIVESNRYSFEFDLNKLLAEGSDTVNVEEKKVSGAVHGTQIFLSQLRSPINLEKYKEICEDLKELYQFFTSGVNSILDLNSEFDETPCKLNAENVTRPVLDAPVHKTIKEHLYAIGPNKKWKEDVDFKYRGTQIKGFIQLLQIGSYTNNPGLILLRHNRVIMGTTRIPYIPERLFGTANKYGKQRIYGVLHLDHLPVSYTKDSFVINENEFIDQIKSDPKITELLRQSGAYRANGTCIAVASEAEISKAKDKINPTKKPDAKPNTATDKGGSNGDSGQKNNTTQNASNPVQTNGFVSVLKGLKTSSLGLTDIINEAIIQYENEYPISTALCLRVIVETGTLQKLESINKIEYAKIAHLGIKRVLQDINKNHSTYLSAADHKARKCIESLCGESQLNIILLNNISHGHYHPTLDELNKLMSNIQPLLEWAYSANDV